MVGHTHQDFLPGLRGKGEYRQKAHHVDLSTIRDFKETHGLFDLDGACTRKVNLSHLDEHLDGIRDWNDFIRTLSGVSRLYIVDDRETINPIMREFGEELTQRYLTKLSEDGIRATLVSCRQRQQD